MLIFICIDCLKTRRGCDWKGWYRPVEMIRFHVLRMVTMVLKSNLWGGIQLRVTRTDVL